MNRPEIIDFLFKQCLGAANIEVSDLDYSFPSEEWIRGTFSRSWMAYNFSRGLENYQPEKNDCEDFARRCASYACDLHAGNSNGNKTGLAFGEFYYSPNEGDGQHAINVAIVAKGNDNAPALAFFEPQSGEVITLTEEERSSCTLLKI